MTPPVIVTAPVDPVVTLGDLKLHLRVDAADDDAKITALEKDAVAYLDGWKGVLGRAIKSQVWRQEYQAGEKIRLLLPDVSSLTATGYDSADVETSVAAVLKHDFKGPYVEVTGAYARVVIDYTCAMPAEQLFGAQSIVKMMVERDFDRPSGAEYDALMRSIDMGITSLRWMDA